MELRTGLWPADVAHLTECGVECRMPVRKQQSSVTSMGCDSAFSMFAQASLCLEHAGGNLQLCSICLLNIDAGCIHWDGRDVSFGLQLMGMMLHAHGKVCMDCVKAFPLCHCIASSELHCDLRHPRVPKLSRPLTLAGKKPTAAFEPRATARLSLKVSRVF